MYDIPHTLHMWCNSTLLLPKPQAWQDACISSRQGRQHIKSAAARVCRETLRLVWYTWHHLGKAEKAQRMLMRMHVQTLKLLASRNSRHMLHLIWKTWVLSSKFMKASARRDFQLRRLGMEASEALRSVWRCGQTLVLFRSWHWLTVAHAFDNRQQQLQIDLQNALLRGRVLEGAHAARSNDARHYSLAMIFGRWRDLVRMWRLKCQVFWTQKAPPRDLAPLGVLYPTVSGRQGTSWTLWEAVWEVEKRLGQSDIMFSDVIQKLGFVCFLSILPCLGHVVGKETQWHVQNSTERTAFWRASDGLVSARCTKALPWHFWELVFLLQRTTAVESDHTTDLPSYTGERCNNTSRLLQFLEYPDVKTTSWVWQVAIAAPSTWKGCSSVCLSVLVILHGHGSAGALRDANKSSQWAALTISSHKEVQARTPLCFPSLASTSSSCSSSGCITCTGSVRSWMVVSCLLQCVESGNDAWRSAKSWSSVAAKTPVGRIGTTGPVPLETLRQCMARGDFGQVPTGNPTVQQRGR